MTTVDLDNTGKADLVAADFDGDGRDDVVIGFGAAGVWKFSNNAWSFVHPYPVTALAAGRIH
jgi:hypothetical protein